MADQHICTLQDQACLNDCVAMSVRFDIDRAQFVAAIDANEPPRRQVTFVTMDDQSFSATAILFPGGVSGFHEDAGEIGSRLMIVQPDGSARLALQPSNQVWIGMCVRS